MSECEHTRMESALHGDECAQCLRESKSELAPARGSAATSELSEIINAARERGCAEHGHEIKWLIELPMTDEEMKRFNDITGWPSRKQPNGQAQRPPEKRVLSGKKMTNEKKR